MASYVLYGFDTAGTLAEETDQPRRRAPRAILQALGAAAVAGALLILFGILAVSDPAHPELGRITGGLPFLVKDVLGPGLGTLFLVDVIFAVFVCALAVHAGTVRLIFAMARDNNLPFARSLGHVPATDARPDPAAAPDRRSGRGSSGREYQPAPRDRDPLRGRHRLGEPGVPAGHVPDASRAVPRRGPRAARRRRSGRGRRRSSKLFSMGRFGLPVNAIAVVWGVFVVMNISWPRTEIYGPDPWGRFAAPWRLWPCSPSARSTISWSSAGRRGSWQSTRLDISDGQAGRDPLIEGHWIGQLAPVNRELARVAKLNRHPAEASMVKRPWSCYRRRKVAKPQRERRAPGQLQRVLGWCVHAYTALGLVVAGMIAVLLVQGGPGRLPLVVPADGRRHARRRDRRHPGPQGPHQGGRAQLRRPPAGRHHRLPHLHVPALAA